MKLLHNLQGQLSQSQCHVFIFSLGVDREEDDVPAQEFLTLGAFLGFSPIYSFTITLLTQFVLSCCFKEKS